MLSEHCAAASLLSSEEVCSRREVRGGTRAYITSQRQSRSLFSEYRLRASHPRGTSLAIVFLPVAVILLPSLSCFPPFAPQSCGLQQKPLNLLFPLYEQLLCSQFR
ncbi:unnamed protein product [Rangifer tarandus platyrhynchus]|uniref:Uncharacterized protein n=2 Tax=Rangifer tarandus platyrhynchus TaxID=3082113 RepID=A0AC59Y9Y0_RANTA|nr:unnamed protein product [Rangifer tarandus platyrhynchus]